MAVVSNLLPIVGEWTFEKNKANYVAAAPSFGRPFGIAVSGATFTEGRAETVATLSAIVGDSSARLLFGFQSIDDGYYTAGVGGYGNAFVISRFDPTNGWTALATAGTQSHLKSGQAYRLAVNLRGQRLQLDIDGIRALEQSLPVPVLGGQLGVFAWGTTEVQFRDLSVSAKKRIAFVAMQLDGTFQQLYEDVIRPCAEAFDLDAFHAADVFGPGAILDDIIQSIVDASLVIAEVTSHNPNVLYEVGYAHALRKPTILLAEVGKALPFDIRGDRCIFYENSIGGKRKVEDALRRHLDAIFRKTAS